MTSEGWQQRAEQAETADTDWPIDLVGMQELERSTEMYPVTIIQTRYGGSYEGGEWAAFHCFDHQIPTGAQDSDIECMTFWRSDAAKMVGRGHSPDAALADLDRRLGPNPAYIRRGDPRD